MLWDLCDASTPEHPVRLAADIWGYKATGTGGFEVYCLFLEREARLFPALLVCTPGSSGGWTVTGPADPVTDEIPAERDRVEQEDLPGACRWLAEVLARPEYRWARAVAFIRRHWPGATHVVLSTREDRLTVLNRVYAGEVTYRRTLWRRGDTHGPGIDVERDANTLLSSAEGAGVDPTASGWTPVASHGMPATVWLVDLDQPVAIAPPESDPRPVWNQHSNDIGDWCPYSSRPLTVSELRDEHACCGARCAASSPMRDDEEE
ncbi:MULTISPECIES: hypothetical protein [Actinosynnema]|uniref:hypothetical protein n=1 Tax=Actinosynnema TaxID=40566 RepID=UPI0020A545D9|nr:hypothetical protein [Actinosynnema pretiosum]